MGNICKAADDMRPKSLGLPSEEEAFVINFEKQLNIQHVEYETFERCIKRFGYRIALTDDCWRSTVAETNVDVSKFKEHGNIQHSYFQHKKLCDSGRYDARKVLYVSFLHCKHRARISQERALWGIINPHFKDGITHTEADEFFDELALIAIDLPLKHCTSWLKTEAKRLTDDENYIPDEETKVLAEKFEKAKAYLEKSQAVKEEMVESLTHALGD